MHTRMCACLQALTPHVCKSTGVHVCTCTHVRARVYVCAHAWIRRFVCACTHACMGVCGNILCEYFARHVSMQIHACPRMYLCMHKCMHVCMCVCACVCMCVRVCVCARAHECMGATVGVACVRAWCICACLCMTFVYTHIHTHVHPHVPYIYLHSDSSACPHTCPCSCPCSMSMLYVHSHVHPHVDTCLTQFLTGLVVADIWSEQCRTVHTVLLLIPFLLMLHGLVAPWLGEVRYRTFGP